jgi:hypothetical protein
MTVVDEPAAIDPASQVSVPSLAPLPWRVQVAPLALANLEAAGRSAISVTLVAVVGPAFAIVAV